MKTINTLDATTVAEIEAGAKALMNPATGSVDTVENWALEGHDEKSCFVAVVWDVPSESWIEA